MTDLTYLEAYIAISQVKARYCRTLDTKDWTGYGDVFTGDIEFDMTPSGVPLIRGRDEAVRFVRSALETAVTAHHVHSPEIKLDGDVAHVIWAMQDRVIWGADRAAQMGNIGHIGFGHYHERYTRQDGQWRIAALRLAYLHMDNYYDKPAG